MNKAVIVGYARSPFHFAHKGKLAKVRSDEMSAKVIRTLIDSLKVNETDIEDLIMGCAFPEGEQGFNIARIVGFLSKLPIEVAGTTINRFCGSSMQSIHIAAGAIALDAGKLFVCAGIESMSRVPMTGFNPMPNANLYREKPEVYISMGETAENVAKKYKIGRSEQDEFSLMSHQKAFNAQKSDYFQSEIVPIHNGVEIVQSDGCIRPKTTIDDLSNLNPAFMENGLVTAGTSSPLTDGASAVLVCSSDYAKENNLPILASIKSIAVHGCNPETMGMGPVFATKKALERANMTINDIDIIELNEAFASQALAVIKESSMNLNKVNIDGGAIALGHPLGATGARIVGKAASLLKRENKQFALATQCIGGGQGIATILEAA
ncbi:MAG: acetyl-CoA C-acyltransferase [Rhodospirillaceae bacterium]|nr:acetyl-CoA C-acyltransferase [Rhodospirillaceae bacterium]|tara:strand:- start:18966 stop:20102 length:1137 start_codon:yes stop_codon:yes gene_type:complete